ncbi:TPA: KilA-N domain-containing protein [Klebsiella michiganensis]|nr:KilA-N domain-containing protein [Klebsiella michiganensis]
MRRCRFSRPDIIHLLFNTIPLSLLSCLTGLVSNDTFPSLGEKATAGRFNLNVLHKASGLGANKAPAQWLRTQTAKSLLAELEKKTVQICIVSDEGRNGGTFVHKLLAIEYAGWILPRFCTSTSRLKHRRFWAQRRLNF